MKKTWITLLIMIGMVLLFAACGCSEEPDDDEEPVQTQEQDPEDDDEEGSVVGGWQLAEDPQPAELPDEVQRYFDGFTESSDDELVFPPSDKDRWTSSCLRKKRRMKLIEDGTLPSNWFKDENPSRIKAIPDAKLCFKTELGSLINNLEENSDVWSISPKGKAVLLKLCEISSKVAGMITFIKTI